MSEKQIKHILVTGEVGRNCKHHQPSPTMRRLQRDGLLLTTMVPNSLWCKCILCFDTFVCCLGKNTTFFGAYTFQPNPDTLILLCGVEVGMDTQTLTTFSTKPAKGPLVESVVRSRISHPAFLRPQCNFWPWSSKVCAGVWGKDFFIEVKSVILCELPMSLDLSRTCAFS